MKPHPNGICLLAGILLLSMFLLNMFGCSGAETKIPATINQSASLSMVGPLPASSLPANPLQWKIITSAIDKADSTMSTLYGNELAVRYARANSQHNYPTGSVLSLVTWTQREDDRWFGAKIPDRVKSVEFVGIDVAADGRPTYSYREYQGTPLTMVSEQKGFTPNDRAAFLLAQRAAVLP
jgi:cytochrome P460